MRRRSGDDNGYPYRGAPNWTPKAVWMYRPPWISGFRRQQKRLREQLAKDSVFEGATAVVMEVSTGAVRAIVNMKTKNGLYDETFNYAISQSTNPVHFQAGNPNSAPEDGSVKLTDSIKRGNRMEVLQEDLCRSHGQPGTITLGKP